MAEKNEGGKLIHGHFGSGPREVYPEDAPVVDLASRRKKKLENRTVMPPHRDALPPPPPDTRKREDILLAKAAAKAAATFDRICDSQGPERLVNMGREIEEFVHTFDALDNTRILESIVYMTDHEIDTQPAYCIALFRKLKERFPNIS